MDDPGNSRGSLEAVPASGANQDEILGVSGPIHHIIPVRRVRVLAHSMLNQRRPGEAGESSGEIRSDPRQASRIGRAVPALRIENLPSRVRRCLESSPPIIRDAVHDLFAKLDPDRQGR